MSSDNFEINFTTPFMQLFGPSLRASRSTTLAPVEIHGVGFKELKCWLDNKFYVGTNFVWQPVSHQEKAETTLQWNR